MIKFLRSTNFIWLLFYTLVFFILLQNSFSYLDPDLGWHLEVGKQSLIDRDVARADLYNFPLNGTNWADHEWLSNIILYLIHQYAGYLFLNIFFTLLIVFALWLFNNYLAKAQRLNAPILAIFFFELLALLGMSPHLGVRIQELGILFLVLLFLIIAKIKKTKSQKLLFFTPIFFFVWANLHGSFMVGLVIFWSYFVYELLGPYLQNWKIFSPYRIDLSLDKKQKTHLFFACLTASLLPLLTPYGLEYFSFVQTYSGSHYLAHIMEWLPAWTMPIKYYQLIYLAITALFLILPVLLREKRKYSLWRFSLTILFFYLALKSRRHFPLFFIVSFPLVLEYLFGRLKQVSNKPPKNIFPNNFFLSFFLGAVYLTSITYLLISSNYTNQPFQNQRFCSKYPCAILGHISNNDVLQTKQILNDYSWGGWLIHAWPGKQIFIDGRIPQYPYDDRTFLEEYFDFFKADLVETQLEKHRVEMVLYKKQKSIKANWFEKNVLGFNEENFNSRVNQLGQYLDSSPNWSNVYEDRVGIIYIKK